MGWFEPLNLHQDGYNLETHLNQPTHTTSPVDDPERSHLSSPSSSVRTSFERNSHPKHADNPSLERQNASPWNSRPNLDPAKKLKAQFETVLVYGHILEAVAAFTCLLVLFNVVILSNRILDTSSERVPALGKDYELIRVFGAVAYGVTVYVGLGTQLISLAFLLVMVRTRFKYNQAGVPKPNSPYLNLLLLTHVVVGLHWFGVAAWLFIDPGYIDCFNLGNFGGSLDLAVRLHRLCDLVWLVKFLAILNLTVWSSLTLFLAIFVNHYYIPTILTVFPSLRGYALVKDLLHAIDFPSSPTHPAQDPFYALLSGP
ncbi:hypothetical protein L0F63_006202 [Massospora cicadina]|nr:hypothetical protein L0F63_006202 [Massospora cicadina]